MTNVRAIVLRTAGTNCDDELVRAFAGAGAEVERLHLNALSKDPARLADAQVLGIAGGFSYGDYVAAGRIFGLELRTRLAEPLRRFVADGNAVLGVCNGFQILVELGLFQPDRAPSERTIALTDNASNRFECRWVTLQAERNTVCPWLEPGERFPVPVANKEGRFVVKDEATLAELTERGQVALRYVAPDEAASPRAAGEPVPYPANPNGSAADIAGITDPTGRVLGLMPHPERNLTRWSHPRWTRAANGAQLAAGDPSGPDGPGGEGRRFFRRLVEAASGAAASLTS